MLEWQIINIRVPAISASQCLENKCIPSWLDFYVGAKNGTNVLMLTHSAFQDLIHLNRFYSGYYIEITYSKKKMTWLSTIGWKGL